MLLPASNNCRVVIGWHKHINGKLAWLLAIMGEEL